MHNIYDEYEIKAKDFIHAGEGSIKIKNALKSLDLKPDIIRRVSICAYESEMNVVMHGGEGVLSITVDSTGIILEARDKGPGIGDVNLALSEGYSTAQELYREMGFGAGMGLPNIVKNSDSLEIYSQKDKGTYLIISFWMEKGEG
jgi:anti-sigma regulatory factor (Ser/Thr protein kinase)